MEIKSTIQLRKLVAGYMCLVYYRRLLRAPLPSERYLHNNNGNSHEETWKEGMADAMAWMALSYVPDSCIKRLAKAGGIFLKHVGSGEGQNYDRQTVNLAAIGALAGTFNQDELEQLFPFVRSI